jgi:hypothetical protein
MFKPFPIGSRVCLPAYYHVGAPTGLVLGYGLGLSRSLDYVVLALDGLREKVEVTRPHWQSMEVIWVKPPRVRKPALRLIPEEIDWDDQPLF